MNQKVGNYTKSASIKSFVLTQIILLIILFIVSFFSFRHSFETAKKNSMALNEKTVLDVSRQLSSFIQNGSGVLSSVAETISFMLENNKSNSEILEYLRYISASQHNAFQNSNPSIYGFINNEYLDSTGWIPTSDFTPKSSNWYVSAHVALKKVAVVPPYNDPKTNKTVISLSKRLDDLESVVSMDIPMEDFQMFASSIVKNNADLVFIADKTGNVIAHSEPGELGKNYFSGIFKEEHGLLKRALDSFEDKYETEYKNQPSIVISKRLYNDWVLIMITDEKQLAKKAFYEIFFLLAGFALVFLLVFYFCTSNFQARIRLSKYANLLNKHKNDLEHQVIEQWNQLDKNKRDLVSMQESVIEGMATIIEYRDVNTGMHVQHTKHYVQMLTDYLYTHHLHEDEVNERYVSMIGNAAAMHDIGKVAISDRILNKPSKLDDDEYEMMKQHTILGAGLVRQVFGKSIDEDMLRICIDVVQYHHEKWDGTGYPIGLVGEDIPLSARIMAIADVFDAIVSRRIYKDSVPVEEVFDTIKKNAGTHFDPELAEIFLGMKDQIKKYLEASLL